MENGVTYIEVSIERNVQAQAEIPLSPCYIMKLAQLCGVLIVLQNGLVTIANISLRLPESWQECWQSKLAVISHKTTILQDVCIF